MTSPSSSISRPKGDAPAWMEFANSLFPDSRPMTAEESREYHSAIAPLYSDIDALAVSSSLPQDERP